MCGLPPLIETFILVQLPNPYLKITFNIISSTLFFILVFEVNDKKTIAPHPNTVIFQCVRNKECRIHFTA